MSNLQSKIDYSYIDFGCGHGKSMQFANSIVPGEGLGIDASLDAVSVCQARGFHAETKDVLSFTERNVCSATFAIDLMPELTGKQEFEEACINIIRAARDFSVIQHSNFDLDGLLAASGLYSLENISKKIKFKPTLYDYLFFIKRYSTAIGLVGFAAFTFGDPKISGVFDEHMMVPQEEYCLTRTLRVVFARKEQKRFLSAVQKVGIGKRVFIWTGAETG